MHPAHRLAPCAALLLAAASPLAHTIDTTSPYAAAIESAAAPAPLSARVTVATQYVARGIRQSWGRPALQAGVDYTAPGGWRAGATWYHYPGARVPGGSTGYLDLGAKHEFGPGLLLKLHAGDGRVAGSGNGVWNWRDLAAGLSTRLEGGWTVALNLTRAIGGAGGTSVYDRYRTGNVRADGRPWAASAGRRTAVLSLSRRF